MSLVLRWRGPGLEGMHEGKSGKATQGEVLWSYPTGQVLVRSLRPFQSDGRPLMTSQESGVGLCILK